MVIFNCYVSSPEGKWWSMLADADPPLGAPKQSVLSWSKPCLELAKVWIYLVTPGRQLRWGPVLPVFVCFLTKPETGYTRNSLLDMENTGLSMGFPSTIGTFGVSLEWKDEINYGWSGFQMGVTFEGENLKILVELPVRLVRLLEASNGRAIFHGILRFGMAHSFLPHEYQNKWRLTIAIYCDAKIVIANSLFLGSIVTN